MENPLLIEWFFVQQATFLKTSEKLRYLQLLLQGEGKSWGIEEFIQFTHRRLRSRSWNPILAWQAAEREFTAVEKGFISAVMIQQEHYPKMLKELFEPPFLLYYRGSVESFKKLPVAVVGTRCPDGKAASAAWELGKALGEVGIPVCSGLALGVDSFAQAGNHRVGVGSFAVFGSGVDGIYPPSNKKLAADLLERGGLLISEYPMGTEPAPYRFPQRNRIISGLSPITVVAQAPIKSGALITADFALEQGREVMVLKEGLGGERGKGTALLAESGAQIFDSIEDIVQLLKQYER